MKNFNGSGGSEKMIPSKTENSIYYYLNRFDTLTQRATTPRLGEAPSVVIYQNVFVLPRNNPKLVNIRVFRVLKNYCICERTLTMLSGCDVPQDTRAVTVTSK